ncbi:hypothetical protein AAF712_015429 [Marasmius tenuissimus]|uniref:F-box domain-containing protein n=1 Tax=Marasmius tenuissimus TaxID=585030 RepID=A0ABR2Z9J8_9AGAR
MDAQPTEILGRFFLEAIDGTSVRIEARMGMELGLGGANSLRRVSKQWRAIAESLPLWHRLHLVDDISADSKRGEGVKEGNTKMLEDCLTRARQAGEPLHITLETKRAEVTIDAKGQVASIALLLTASRECQWGSFSYISRSPFSFEMLGLVVEKLHRRGTTWSWFNLDVNMPIVGDDVSWMVEIFGKIGRMPGLEGLGMTLGDIEDGELLAWYIPTAVCWTSRWNWLRDLEIDGTSALFLMIVAITPS